MTTVDEGQVNSPAGPETNGSGETQSEAATGSRWGSYAAAHPDSKRARALRSLRELERRAIDLPIVGKFHTPDKHDAVYVAGLAALLLVGAVELPIALVVLGGHVLVKQHSSRSLSAIGEVMEDVFGPHV